MKLVLLKTNLALYIGNSGTPESDKHLKTCTLLFQVFIQERGLNLRVNRISMWRMLEFCV